MSTRTTGRLLVATPQVDEGIFRRSVVLVLHHDEEGAQGVILNKVMPAPVDAALPGWGEHASAPSTLFAGGPVQTDSALGLAFVPGEGDGQVGLKRIFGAVAVVDLDAPPPVVMGQAGGLRVFAGYAGWSELQLDGEIRRGDWFVCDLEAGDAFTEAPEGLWSRVLARQSAPLSWLATFPDDPSAN